MSGDETKVFSYKNENQWISPTQHNLKKNSDQGLWINVTRNLLISLPQYLTHILDVQQRKTTFKRGNQSSWWSSLGTDIRRSV